MIFFPFSKAAGPYKVLVRLWGPPWWRNMMSTDHIFENMIDFETNWISSKFSIILQNPQKVPKSLKTHRVDPLISTFLHCFLKHCGQKRQKVTFFIKSSITLRFIIFWSKTLFFVNFENCFRRGFGLGKLLSRGVRSRKIAKDGGSDFWGRTHQSFWGRGSG